MYYYCSVKGCKNSYKNGGCFLSYHRIPKHNKEKWLKALGRRPDLKITHHRICSEHFAKVDFVPKSSKHILKKNAVPSLKLPSASVSEYKKYDVPSCSRHGEHNFSEVNLTSPSYCYPTTEHAYARRTILAKERANNISTKVERNVLDVSYQVTQYQTVVNELRAEINRLQSKMKEERPRSADISKLNAEERSAEVRNLREQIVDTFKTQMKLRRKLMEIDAHLLGLGMEAERQHLVISHWESRNNKLYKNGINASRARTQQSIRRRRLNTADSYRSAGHDEDIGSDVDEADGEAAVQLAWGELADIEREQDRWTELRTHIEQKLENCRQRGVMLEDQLPALLSSDDEREILALICRVHELEADKMALQSERLVRQHELKRRDLLIIRYDRQRQLCEEIITRQRQLLEDIKIKLPPDLQELYQMYQQEIHAATYTDFHPPSTAGVSPDKLPPISKIYTDPAFRTSLASEPSMSPPSSSESGEDTMPKDTSVDRVLGHPVSRPGASMKLPPLPPSPPIRLAGRSRDSAHSMRRAISEDQMTSIGDP